jgi:uncharacterized phage protein gp47/JayE
LHGHLVWLSRQLFPDTAESEYLLKWAAIWGLEKTASVEATGDLVITGTNGSTCPIGTLWEDAAGIEYEQDTAGTIAGGTDTVTVTAVEGGADGNQSSGATLSLVSPVSGIDTDGTVTGSGLTQGTDEETDAELLARLLLRLQNPPSGGGPGDYESWALEVSGVTRAWEIPNGDGTGTVVLYFVRDNDTPSIIPDASEISTVQDYLDAAAPVTADVNVYAPTESTLDFTISVTPDTSAIRSAVEDELEDLILRKGEADGCTIYLSQINEAISIATGEEDHTLTNPTADQVYTTGYLPVMGTITWV